jgi:hypothetical protein
MPGWAYEGVEEGAAAAWVWWWRATPGGDEWWWQRESGAGRGFDLEHECKHHLAAHFKLQDVKGQLFDDNLWPASLTCSLKMYNYHMDQMYTKPRVKTYMENHHKKVWARSKFNEACKVDYVNNNLVECFNSRIRKIKVLHLVDMLDKIRQMLMVKFELLQKIASQKLVVTCYRNFEF